MRVVCAGGGTLGPVTPLLAVVEELKQLDPTLQVQWFGTSTGPEQQLVESYGIPFKALTSGKLRRYWSWRNIIDLAHIAVGTIEALVYMVREQVDVVIAAGGYVSVPVGVAAWLWRVPLLIHQQDVRPSLTNKILAPLASRITVALQDSKADFPAQETVVTGNPVRQRFHALSQGAARAELQLNPDLPVLVVLGGGTGAEALNAVTTEALPQLTALAQVVHLTGRGKTHQAVHSPNYRQLDFTVDTANLLAAADVVVTRAGMGVLTELGALACPAVVIPIPGSHQVDNAAYLAQHQAALVLPQFGLTADTLVATVSQLLHSPQAAHDMGRRLAELFPPQAAARVAREVLNLVHHV